MATLTPSRRDRYLYLGGSVETARARARLLALVATLLYASCLFGAVMLAHQFTDNAQPPAASVQTPDLGVPDPQNRAHRF